MTDKGIASCQKVDIFKRLMWFTYEGDFINWHKLTVDQVKEILELNKQKQPVASLEEYMQEEDSPAKTTPLDNSQEGSLTRFDEKPRKYKSKKRQSIKNTPTDIENTVTETIPNKEKVLPSIKEIPEEGKPYPINKKPFYNPPQKHISAQQRQEKASSQGQNLKKNSRKPFKKPSKTTPKSDE